MMEMTVVLSLEDVQITAELLVRIVLERLPLSALLPVCASAFALRTESVTETVCKIVRLALIYLVAVCLILE